MPKFIQLIWQTHRGYTVAMAVLRLCRGFIPLATLWVGKLIIDVVVDMRQAPSDFARLWPLGAFSLIAGGLGFILPGVSAVGAGYALGAALAWRGREGAVHAIEERDGVRFYVEPGST